MALREGPRARCASPEGLKSIGCFRNRQNPAGGPPPYFVGACSLTAERSSWGSSPRVGERTQRLLSSRPGAQGSYGGGPLVTIIQPSIYLPPAIELGLLAGTLIREGSVVRDAVSKQIVKHLKEVPDAGETAEMVASAAARFRRLPRKPVVITTIAVAAVAVTGVVVLQQVKKRAERSLAMPECVRTFGASWDRYRAAIRDKCLDVEIIDQLISDFEGVRQYFEEHGETLDFSQGQGKSVVKFVAEYTSKLADVNSMNLGELREQAQTQEPGRNEAVVDLRRNLAVQRRIFGNAA